MGVWKELHFVTKGCGVIEKILHNNFNIYLACIETRPGELELENFSTSCFSIDFLNLSNKTTVIVDIYVFFVE